MRCLVDRELWAVTDMHIQCRLFNYLFSGFYQLFVLFVNSLLSPCKDRYTFTTA